MGHVGEIDLATLTLWAKAHATALKAHADVRKRGAIVAGARGGRERGRIRASRSRGISPRSLGPLRPSSE